ncbi:hypothetical protein BGZ80_004978 [Entomortierella chlamydospora]|uniref:Uncharacterized protein n=1 Tax=Entomortierella chlamydospora TaxID=101097 RepID=A0A9P6MLP6_9FUNG|nr:hypothetical protein BGZ79_003609 [Entomortierella chlamydospora]KAG0007179.1 hypothetical protein BGZ80_004978 [Entomortierella chlamydospora]
MSSLIPTSGSSSIKDKDEDHVALQTSKLIQLLESIDYPHEISEDAIRSALSSHYHDDHSSSPTPVAKFLDWLIDNVSAETNWPEYQQNQPESLRIFDDPPNIKVDVDDNREDDATLQYLDREYRQLQDTLASLEMELLDLKALESHAIDTNKSLDMDIHDASVQFDATASKLSETARSVLSEYLPPSGLNMDVDIDMERRKSEEVGQEPKQGPSSKRFLYQCQEELLQIQQLDIAYLKDMEDLYQQILNVIDLPRNNAAFNDSTSRSSLTQTPAISRLDQLLKRNPAQEQELVRLCSTYRATKMSHIRVMAQLKCIEEELRYMKDLEMKHEGNGNQEDEQDVTGDYKMYTIASTRNQQIQKTRQQEIELISVQRETARLSEEMDQLLSNPASHEGGQDLSTLMDNSDGTAGGVLVDICERIARSDIELRFLSAAHRDYIREQEHAIKELDSIIERLLEHYCVGVTVEQTLGAEKDIIQRQKDTLWAAIEELRDYNEQSKRLHHSMGNSLSSGNQKSQQSGKRNELLDAFKRNTDLTIEAQEERQKLQEHLDQMLNVRDMLDKQLLHRHSSTNQLQFVPKDVQIYKDELVNRAKQLQQDYAVLNDEAQQLIEKKSKPA